MSRIGGKRAATSAIIKSVDGVKVNLQKEKENFSLDAPCEKSSSLPTLLYYSTVFIV
jgi:hypothetical protein